MKVSKKIVWLTLVPLSVWAVACSDTTDDIVDDNGETGGSPGDGDGDGDGDGTGATTATGGSASGGSPGTGGATGGDGGMGGEAAMGGFGGDPNAFDLADACADRCTTIVSIGCPMNTDQMACEEACVDGVVPGCEEEYDTFMGCEAEFLAEDFMCLTFGPFSSVDQSATGKAKCGSVKDEYYTCADR